MIQQDKPQFIQLLTGIFSLYRQTVSEFMASVFWNACQRYDLDQIREAFNAHVMDSDVGQFPPKPADIVKQLQGTYGDRAMTAWSKFYAAMTSIGPYKSVQFDDGIIHAVVEDLGGWVELAKTSYDELPYLQKRFTDQYRAHSRRPSVRYPHHLCGMIEISNNNHENPRELPPPTIVGNPQIAAAVALGAYNEKPPEVALVTSLITQATKRLTPEQENN